MARFAFLVIGQIQFRNEVISTDEPLLMKPELAVVAMIFRMAVAWSVSCSICVTAKAPGAVVKSAPAPPTTSHSGTSAAIMV